MKYFTKEYIKECDCEEVQNLKSKLVQGDWYKHQDDIFVQWADIYKFTSTMPRSSKFFWLPTGDQLDKEIEKILAGWSKDGEDLGYNTGVSFHCGLMSAHEVDVNNRDCHTNFIDYNPYLAKIKLLKKLLNEK